jgi:hypothetical protein
MASCSPVQGLSGIVRTPTYYWVAVPRVLHPLRPNSRAGRGGGCAWWGRVQSAGVHSNYEKSTISVPRNCCATIPVIDDAGIYYQLGSQYSTNHLHTFQLL